MLYGSCWNSEKLVQPNEKLKRGEMGVGLGGLLTPARDHPERQQAGAEEPDRGGHRHDSGVDRPAGE